jgi:hypothetical protein
VSTKLLYFALGITGGQAAFWFCADAGVNPFDENEHGRNAGQ